MAKIADIKWVNDKFKFHRGDWLTIEVALDYQRRAARLPEASGQIVGERRKLVWELIEKYGVTEIEANNIINGRFIPDYVNKYERIRDRRAIERIARKELDPEDEGE